MITKPRGDERRQEMTQVHETSTKCWIVLNRANMLSDLLVKMKKIKPWEICEQTDNHHFHPH